MRLLAIAPAAASTSSARASRAATNTSVPIRTRRVVLCPVADRSITWSSRRDVRIAGASPKSRTATAVIASAPASAVEFRWTWPSRGRSGGANAAKSRTAPAATATPSTPPAIASKRFSVHNCTPICVRVPPSADRTATSRTRATPRTTRRLATDVRNQEQQARGGGEGEERGADITDHQPWPRGCDAIQRALPGRGVRALQEGAQLVGGTRRRGTGGKSSDDIKGHQGQRLGRQGRDHRRPEVGASGIVQTLGHHADNGVHDAFAIRHDLAADDSRVGVKPVAPGGVAQDCHRFRPVDVISWPKPAAQHWTRSQDVKELPRHERPAQSRHLVAVPNRQRCCAVVEDKSGPLEGARSPCELATVRQVEWVIE